MSRTHNYYSILKDLSKIYKVVETQRLQKVPFDDIVKILFQQGHEYDDVVHVVERIQNEEINDYDTLVNEVDDFNYKGKWLINIFLLLAGLFFFILGCYFAYKLYDVWTTPATIVKENVIIKVNSNFAARLLVGLIGSSLLSFAFAIPLIGSSLKGIRKVQQNRERFIYLRERR